MVQWTLDATANANAMRLNSCEFPIPRDNDRRLVSLIDGLST